MLRSTTISGRMFRLEKSYCDADDGSGGPGACAFDQDLLRAYTSMVGRFFQTVRELNALAEAVKQGLASSNASEQIIATRHCAGVIHRPPFLPCSSAGLCGEKKCFVALV